MISVTISINGNPLMARSAVRTRDEDINGKLAYNVDDGTIVHHDPDDGAVKLAIQLLKTIKESKQK